MGKVFLLGVAIAAVVILCRRLMGSRVSGSDARALVADGALLLDVRRGSEFEGRHLDGAMNIPVQELAQRADELGDKDRTIVVYCQSGGRSAMAKRLLERHGFANVHDMGGIGEW